MFSSFSLSYLPAPLKILQQVTKFQPLIKMSEHLISKYEHFNTRPRDAEALAILHMVAAIVDPIMRRRGWKVGTLVELYEPNRPTIGRISYEGGKIYLALRRCGYEREFFCMKKVVDNMLQLLCHVEHPLLDEPFKTLLAQVRHEYQQLVSTGYVYRISKTWPRSLKRKYVQT